MRPVINICFCFNNSYVDKIAVTILSILFNNPWKFFHFYLFSTDLSSDNIKELEKMSCVYKNYKLHPIHVDRSMFEALKLNITYITVETYFRYIIADLIPDVDKVLYLDGDIIVKGNISKLYKTNLAENYLLGCNDKFIFQEKYAQSLGLSEYINAGVLLMNLKAFRKNNLSQMLIQKTIELADKIRYQDQDILNIVCAKHILFADSIYNFATDNIQTEKDKRKKAVIIHYTGRNKPWNATVAMGKVWYRYRDLYLRLCNDKNKFALKLYLSARKLIPF